MIQNRFQKGLERRCERGSKGDSKMILNSFQKGLKAKRERGSKEDSKMILNSFQNVFAEEMWSSVGASSTRQLTLRLASFRR
jgi:hypothetical protein